MSVPLTPTEDLMMEVIAGRVRCGETLWTFEKRHARTARTLDAKGLVGWKWGIVENTIMVWFTPAGAAQTLSPNYKPPNKR